MTDSLLHQSETALLRAALEEAVRTQFQGPTGMRAWEHARKVLAETGRVERGDHAMTNVQSENDGRVTIHVNGTAQLSDGSTISAADAVFRLGGEVERLQGVESKLADARLALEVIARPGEEFGLSDKLCRSLAQEALMSLVPPKPSQGRADG